MKVWILMSEVCYTGGKILGVWKEQGIQDALDWQKHQDKA